MEGAGDKKSKEDLSTICLCAEFSTSFDSPPYV